MHTRLNIIDIKDRSNQPFHIGPFTLIFNGEIYNYLELKDLQKRELLLTQQVILKF